MYKGRNRPLKIVVLDGHTLNPGDLSWESLASLGEVKIYERTPSDLILSRIADVEVVLTNKTPLRADLLAQLPKLRYIGVLATGYDVVDVGAAAKHGIVVANVPSYGTASVAQSVFALLLELCHRVQRHSDAVFEGEWSRSPDWCFWNYPLVELAGKTMGIVGYGRIGQQVARIAQAFGMQVLAVRRSAATAEASSSSGVLCTDLNTLLHNSDVISLHCPLTADTEEMINHDSLQRMKRSAFLINTARGKLIREDDLAAALNRGTIAGAAIDVLATEPPAPDNPLLGTNNCIITPHLAWATKEARSRLMETAVTNVKAFLSGKPVNIVNNV